MSLEDEIGALRKAVEENTAALAEHTKLLKTGLNRASGAKTSSSTKSEEEEAPKKAAPKRTTTKKATAKKAQPRTAEDVRTGFGEFLNQIEDKAERTKVIETFIGPLNEHFGVTKLGQIGDDQANEALGYLDTLKAALEDGFDSLMETKLGFMSDDDSDEEGDDDDDDGLGI